MLRLLEAVVMLQVLDVESRLRLLEVVVMLQVLDVEARLRLLLHVVNAVLDVKSMLQLLEVLMLIQPRLQLERAVMVRLNHGFHMTGIDLQNSHL